MKILNAMCHRLLFLCAFVITSALFAAERPNIVFIFSDDHATQSIGVYGHPLTKLAPTPNLDKLANSGMRFDRCLVTNSICGPSRATILTGKYSHLNGFYMNEATQFDGSQVTFPKLLRQAGYQTAIVGKWHLGAENPTGFDYWEVLPGQGAYYNPDFRTVNGKVRVTGYCTEIVTEKSINWLKQKRDKNKPFMLMMQHKAPHRNWAPSFKYMDLYEDVTFPEPDTLFDTYEGRGKASRDQDMTISFTMQMMSDLKVDVHVPGTRRYKHMYMRMNEAQRKIHDKTYVRRSEEIKKLGLKGKALTSWKYQAYVRDYLKCIKSVDDSVGEMMDYLKESGLDKNTVVIYSSDQGFYLGEHGWFDKRFMFDESYRTPLLISWPDKIKPGSSTSKLVSNLDFAQTFLDIAGVQADSQMQGMSLVPLLDGDKDDWRKYHYYHYYEFPGWHMVQRHEGVYDGRYKLIHYYDINEWELIDMKTDPQETKSQFDNPEYAGEVKRLKQALQDMRKQYKVPEGNPAPRKIKDPYRYASPEWKKMHVK